MRINLSFIQVTLLGLAIISTNSFAEKTNTPDNEQPINITANSLQASEKQGRSVYKGNVVVNQGSLTLKGEQIDVSHPKGQLTKVIATGQLANFKRFSQIDQAWLKGKAERIEYHAVNKTVLLIGNAEVEQPGKHVISGPRLFYDINQQTLQAQSTETEKKRISVTFNPTPSDTKPVEIPVEKPAKETALENKEADQ